MSFFGLERCGEGLGGRWVALLGQGEEGEVLCASPRLVVHSVTRSATSIKKETKGKTANLIATHLLTSPRPILFVI